MSTRQLREDLKDWKKIIARYQRADHHKAALQMLTSFGPFIGLWIAMYFLYDYSKLLVFGLAIANAFFMVRIFIIQHDCGHYSYFKKKNLNNLVGIACSYISTIPFKYWARAHSFHHSHCGQLEFRDIGDIDTLTVTEFRKKSKWGRFIYRIFRSPIVLFSAVPVYYFTVALRFPTIKMPTIRNMNWSQLRNNIGIAVVYLTLGYLLGWARFFFIQFSIIAVFMVIAFWFFYIQHQHEYTYKEWRVDWDSLMASIQGSTFYKLPRIWTWLTGNIGYHHIHHLSSKIPNYHLIKCADENPVLMKHAQTISFMESLKVIRYKLWDEDKQKMISFKEFYQSEKERRAAA